METDRILAEQFIAKYPLQAAQVLEGLNDDEIAALFRDTQAELLYPLINHMNDYRVASCFSRLPDQLLMHLLENAHVTKVESLLRHYNESYRNSLLEKLSPGLAGVLRSKLSQNEHSVGALMVPITLTFSVEMTAGEALELIRRNRDVVENRLYVVDNQGELEGAVHLKDLFFADEAQSMLSLLNSDIPRVYQETMAQQIIDSPIWEQHESIAVVERDGKLIGTITATQLRLHSLTKSGEASKQIIETSTALGELYRIGLTSFLQSVGR